MASLAAAPLTWPKRIVLAFALSIAAACLVSGSVLVGSAAIVWIEDGFRYSGWKWVDQLIGLFGAGIVDLGLILTGIVIRLSEQRWRWRASGLLALCSTLFALAAFAVLSDIFNGLFSETRIALAGLTLLMLLAVALPPYLHWRQAPNTGSRPGRLNPEG